MQVDPVCHMDLDPAKAGAKSDYQGTTYHFCSMDCKQKFDANPQQYVREMASHGSGGKK